MNCFLFIFMITLTVATSNPVYDLSYKEIVDLVNSCNSLKEENEKFKDTITQIQMLILALSTSGSTTPKLTTPEPTTPQPTTTTLIDEERDLAEVKAEVGNYSDLADEITRVENRTQMLISALTSSSNEQCETEHQALKSSNEQLEKEHQALKSSKEQLDTEHQALKSSKEQLETQHQALKSSKEQLDTEHQALKSSKEQLDTEHQALKSSKEQLETEHQDLKSSKEQLETEHQDLKRQMPKPGDCEDIYACGKTNDGVYTIYPDNSPMQVYCEMSQTQGSIVIQKRTNGDLAYDKMFQEYSDGFGDLKAEHWLGLSLMNRITATGRWKLRIELVSVKNEARYAEYSDFKIGAAPGFQLLFDISSYKGDAGNNLGYHHNMRFSSRDKDQDERSGNCSAVYGNSGWWFRSCRYVMTTAMPYSSHGIWWHGYQKSATLKIKKF